MSKKQSKGRSREQLSAAAKSSRGRSKAKHEEWPPAPAGFKYCLECSEVTGTPTLCPETEFYKVKAKYGTYLSSNCKEHVRLRVREGQIIRKVFQERTNEQGEMPN